MKRIIVQLCVLFPYLGYAAYSYALVDPNLVLSTFPLYWKAQEWMWQLGYHQRDVSQVLYVVSVLFMFVAGYVVIRYFSESEKRSTLISIALILFLSHNALSHDMFNYIFNVRMVVKYGVDPHVHTALEFPSDDWTRFMHNTHTAAPYGYGWTTLSLTPYVLGGGKFALTYFLMKAWVIVGFVMLWYAMDYCARMFHLEKTYTRAKWMFFLNPLVLIETFSNAHNDAWMMAPALFAVAYMAKSNKRTWWVWGIGVVFLALSASIKFATLALIPLIGVMMIAKHVKRAKWTRVFYLYWAEFASVLLFLPLFTARSQQFHPWYLMWSMSFVPFMRVKWAQLLFVAFSVSSLMRYVPYILVGEYTQSVLFDQRIITWVGGVGIFIVMILRRIRYEKREL